jgi:hypothetical protein
MVIPTKGYSIEGVNKFGNTYLSIPRDEIMDYSTSTIDHKDNDAHWFRSYFLTDPVYTFFGYTLDNDPVLISVKIEDRQWRCICRTKKEGADQRRVIDFLTEDTDWKTRIERATAMTLDHLVEINHDQLISSGLQDEILKLDETSVKSQPKIIFTC